MNFVVVAGNRDCRPLLAAIAESKEHRLLAAACDAVLRADFATLAEEVYPSSDWQRLLTAPGLEAAIVCGHDKVVQDAAWQFAAAGLHLVVYPDALQTASFAYRLWPTAIDGANVLMPVFSHRLHPQWRELRDSLQRGDLGRIRFLELSRSEPAGASGLVDEQTLNRTLLLDCDLLRWLCGDYTRVTCLQTGRSDGGLASQSVTLAGEGCPEANWHAKASGGESQWRLTISGDAKTEIYTSEAGFADAAGDVTTIRSAEHDSGAAILTEFERRLEGNDGGHSWSELVRDFDVLDAAQRSIRRRRTVEVGSDEFSERSQFKSTMSAAGCGVLLYTMFALVFALLAGALLDPRDAAQKRSQSAGFVLRAEDFVGESAELSPSGEAHVDDIRNRLWQTTAEVMIDPAGMTPAAADRRRATVAGRLSTPADPIDDNRVVVRDIQGQWFQRGMLIAWILVFLPGGLILLLQGLLLVTRPAGTTGGPPHSTDR